MADQPKNLESDPFTSATDFRMAYDNEADPKYMLINVPLQGLSEDRELGTAILRGRLDEAKQIALNQISKKRQRRAQIAGIVAPNGLTVQ